MLDRYALHDQYIANQETASYDKSIVALPHPVIALNPHNDTADKPSSIHIGLYLSSLDRENAVFIVKHAQEINEML